MRNIEITSCDTCQFAYENDRRKLNCELSSIVTEHVEDGEIHLECPLRKGPIEFCLSKESGSSEDIARSKRCRDCGKPFNVTYGELRFLEEKFGPSFGEPTRCKACRQERKRNNGEAR